MLPQLPDGVSKVGAGDSEKQTHFGGENRGDLVGPVYCVVLVHLGQVKKKNSNCKSDTCESLLLS